MEKEQVRLKPEYELAEAVKVLMDNIDFESGACRLNEMIGALIPNGVLGRVRNALAEIPDPFSIEGE